MATSNLKTVVESGTELSLNQRIQNALDPAEIRALLNKTDGYGMVLVQDKFHVTPMIYHLTASLLDSILRHLIAGVDYEPVDLIGDKWWSTFSGTSKGGLVEFELCIKHFAAHPESKLVDNENGTFSLLVE